MKPGRNGLLLLLVVLLTGFSLTRVSRHTEGADDRATAQAEALHPGYQPWAKPLFGPVSHEVETGLFALQAAIGAGVLGYILGLARGRHERRRDAPD